MLACNEFHLFPVLPSEIRVKIWGIALSVPRNVNVVCEIVCDEDIQPCSPRSVRSLSPCEPPALLQVCRESRFETLQIYKPFFRTESILKNIYVAFSQDTIITSETFDIMWMAELQGIQKMKIKINSIHRFFPFGITALKKMQPDLRELELVFEQGVIYNRYGSRQTVTDDIRYRIGQGWDCCPDMKIVNGQTGEIVEWILGRSISSGSDHSDNQPSSLSQPSMRL